MVESQKVMCHLQRMVCLTITGATRTAPQLALETFLNIPPLETYVRAEAQVTAFRLQSNIKRNLQWRRDHSSIVEDVLQHNTLRGPVDRIKPVYLFSRPFRVLKPNGDAWSMDWRQFNPNTEHWFTDADVNTIHSGFGIYNANTGECFCRPLGIQTEKSQADLFVIIKCALEILANRPGNAPIRIYSSSQAANLQTTKSNPH